MIRHRLKILGSCLLGACLFMVLLNFLSEWRANRANGFIRKLPSHEVLGKAFMKLPVGSWYFAGMDAKYVLLANWSVRQKLLKIDYHTKDSTSLRVYAPDTMKFSKGAFIVQQAFGLYIIDGYRPLIVWGDRDSLHLTKLIRVPYFATALPLSGSSFIFKMIGKDRQNLLTKGNSHSLTAQRTLEGGDLFNTDGALTMDQSGTRLFYSYYYRNQFLCLDTNLKILYKGKSIDTVSHAQIKVGRIESLHQTTLAAPPKFVKEQISANDKYLFVHSALKANNEQTSTLKQFTPIDIYDNRTGKYRFSIYVINFAKEKLRDFRVFDDTLITLYDHYIYIHELKF